MTRVADFFFCFSGLRLFFPVFQGFFCFFFFCFFFLFCYFSFFVSVNSPCLHYLSHTVWHKRYWPVLISSILVISSFFPFYKHKTFHDFHDFWIIFLMILWFCYSNFAGRPPYCTILSHFKGVYFKFFSNHDSGQLILGYL